MTNSRYVATACENKENNRLVWQNNNKSKHAVDMKNK